MYISRYTRSRRQCDDNNQNVRENNSPSNKCWFWRKKRNHCSISCFKTLYNNNLFMRSTQGYIDLKEAN